jgi:hypothetical protein
MASNQRESITKNLESMGNNSFKSFLPHISQTFNCEFLFLADCWDWARIANFSFQEVLNQVSDNAYKVLGRMVDELYLRQVEFSGLWRPIGSAIHLEGRGLDIRAIVSETSAVKFNINQSSTEPALAKILRDWCYPGNPDVSQYLSPWKICNEKIGLCKNTCCDNDRESANHKLHLNHAHLTILP